MKRITGKLLTSLNPCSNGILIEDINFSRMKIYLTCLNPCSNGILIEDDDGPVKLYKLCLNPCSIGILIEENNYRNYIQERGLS